MIERLILVVLLFAAGFVVCAVLRWYHAQRVSAAVPADPILRAVRPGVPAIVYFTTPGCVPCRTQQQPALLRLSDELGEAVQIVRVDASEDPETAGRWGVFTAPTTFILDAHHRVRQVNYGVADAARLRQQLEQARAAI